MHRVAGSTAVAPVAEEQPAPHVERAAMIEQLAGSQHQRLAVHEQTNPQPVGPGNERRHRRLDVRRIEEAGDVSSRPGGPAQRVRPGYPHRTATDGASGADTEETVTDGEARFDSAFAYRTVAVLMQQPLRMGRTGHCLLQRQRLLVEC